MSDSIQSGFNATIHFDGFQQKRERCSVKWNENATNLKIYYTLDSFDLNVCVLNWWIVGTHGERNKDWVKWAKWNGKRCKRTRKRWNDVDDDDEDGTKVKGKNAITFAHGNFLLNISGKIYNNVVVHFAFPSILQR